MEPPWVDRLLADLERQAETARLLERDAEVDELAQDAYRSVGWVDRLRASRGREVSVSVLGYGPLVGTVERVGCDWCLVRSSGVDLVIVLEAVLTVRGLRDAVVGQAADPVWSRLGIGSVLREAIRERRALRVFLRDGTQVQGEVLRSGSDFCELAVAGARQETVVVPWRQLSAFTSR